MELVFRYFLHKDYLTSIFREAEEEIVLHSENDKPFISEGETLELIIGDNNSISAFQIEVLEVSLYQTIDLSIQIKDFVDKGLSTPKEDERAIAFMRKHLGLDMYFRLEFFEDIDKVRVVEKGELKKQDLSWYGRAFWKMLGWYFKFKHRYIHEQIKLEIENTD